MYPVIPGTDPRPYAPLQHFFPSIGNVGARDAFKLDFTNLIGKAFELCIDYCVRSFVHIVRRHVAEAETTDALAVQLKQKADTCTWSVAPWDFLWVDRALEDKCASQLGGGSWRA